MRETPLSFKNADPTSPEGMIFAIVKKAVELYSSPKDFIDYCVQFVIQQAGESMSDGQEYRMKLAAIELGKLCMPLADQIEALLIFVLYGTWQSVGLEKNPTENALDDAQRGAMLYLIWGASSAVIASHQQNLAARIELLTPLSSWTFEMPDWQLETPA